MDYISAKETATTWDVSLRTVQKYCIAGRVPGAHKMGNNWFIPIGSKKPEDPRKAQSQPEAGEQTYMLYATLPWPRKNPEDCLASLGEPFRTVLAANLSGYKGNYKPAKELWKTVKPDDMVMPTVALLASGAAISSGDYALFHEIQDVLESCKARTTDKLSKEILSMPATMAAVNMLLPAMAPEWLKEGDFSMFPMELRPFLLYLYCLHLRNLGDATGTLAAAKTALALLESDRTYMWVEIYFKLVCSGGCYYSGEKDEARRYLKEALKLGAPFGLISFYAEWLVGYGGMVEDMLAQEYPHLVKPVTELWKTTFSNWNSFRNRFTHENITTILTLQEFHTAQLFARGMTYQQTAQTLNISVSRVKGLISSSYEKLSISGRDELKKHVLTY